MPTAPSSHSLTFSGRTRTRAGMWLTVGDMVLLKYSCDPRRTSAPTRELPSAPMGMTWPRVEGSPAPWSIRAAHLPCVSQCRGRLRTRHPVACATPTLVRSADLCAGDTRGPSSPDHHGFATAGRGTLPSSSGDHLAYRLIASLPSNRQRRHFQFRSRLRLAARLRASPTPPHLVRTLGGLR